MTTHTKRHRRRSTKGSRSKTHHGDKDYTTKRGNKDFHRKHRDVKLKRRPFSRRKSRSKRGGHFGALFNQALVPFSLFALNQTMGRKKHHKSHKRHHKSHKRRR